VPPVRALVIDHDSESPAGRVGIRLESLGFVLDVAVATMSPDDPRPAGHLPGLDGYDLVVPCGAVWSVYDASCANWVEPELALLRDAHSRGVPVLGLCFGGQALAAALGGRVEKAPGEEIGWFEVVSDQPELIDPGPWLQWHHDRFAVPPGAVELARSDLCPQAFRAGRSLGLQFHPEIDLPMLETWVAGCDADYLARYRIEPDALLAESRRLIPQSEAAMVRLLDRFLAW
jgi:GMP synthase-like glutamine amidotransferase